MYFLLIILFLFVVFYNIYEFLYIPYKEKIKYYRELDKLKEYQTSKSYFFNSAIKLAKENHNLMSIDSIRVFKDIDYFYQNSDVYTIHKNLQYYLKYYPELTNSHMILRKLIHMKVENYIYMRSNNL